MDGFWEPQLLIGRKIQGRYQLVEPFASGGMGVVFRAIDLKTNKTLAVKVLQPHAAIEPEMIKRICAEAEALSRIDHPSVVRIVASGAEAGLSPWIAMELVEGEDLARRIAKARDRGEAALPTDDVLAMGCDIANALVAVHAIGLVHRDVKPGNIVTNRMTKRSKLVDFGISKRLPGHETSGAQITRPGLFVGTTDFAAPEQYVGDAVAESDVYSLAATIAEALGGGPRVDASGEHRGWPNVLRPLIARGEPDRLIDLLARSLDERAEQRPSSAVFRDELELVLKDRTAKVPVQETRRDRRAAVDPDAETRAPRPSRPKLEVETRAPKLPRVETFGEMVAIDQRRGREERAWPAWLRPVALAAAFAAFAVFAAVLAGAAPYVWSVLQSVSGEGSLPVHVAGAADAPKYARIATTRAAIRELEQSFARDLAAPEAERDVHLRYDCTRMARLRYDVEAVDHPLAYEGRETLEKLATEHRAACEATLAKRSVAEAQRKP